jgi:hypothetical protein
MTVMAVLRMMKLLKDGIVVFVSVVFVVSVDRFAKAVGDAV